jgi:hypothetical protein
MLLVGLEPRRFWKFQRWTPDSAEPQGMVFRGLICGAAGHASMSDLIQCLRGNVIEHRRLHFGQLHFALLRCAVQGAQQCLVPDGHFRRVRLA